MIEPHSMIEARWFARFQRLTVFLVAAGLCAAQAASAGKPVNDVGVYLGNGAPSGPHFNLNFNAKQDHFSCPPAKFVVTTDANDDGDLGDTVEICDPGDVCEQKVGNVIFLPREQNGDPITVVMESGAKGPKSSPDASKLEVTDWCTESFPDDGGNGMGDGASLRLPRNAEGYAVYGWVKGKLGERSFSVVPSLDLVEDEAGNDLILLGLVSADGVFKSDGMTLYRIDANTKGKGKNNFTDMTALFEWTGSVCYVQDDVDAFCLDDFGNNTCTDRPLCCIDETDPPDGVFEHCDDLADVGIDPDGDGALECPLVDRDGFPYTSVAAVCRDYEEEWVFNVGDFVNVLWEIRNSAYHVQIRFYPLPLKN